MAAFAKEPVTFTYVRIPADGTEPPEELSATTSKAGDVLSEKLVAAFAGGSLKNVDGLRAEYGAAVDEKMEQLNIMASRGSVEVFALVRPSENTLPTPHSGTYLYFDEMGVLKGLPVNKRAAQIAATCGLDVESPFLGDVYLGRVQVQPSPMRNVSFSLSELDSGSPFMRSAPSENAQYQMAMAEYEKAAKSKTAEATGRANANAGGTAPPGAASSSSGEAQPAPGGFKWAQTPDDLEVTVALPAGTAKKDVQVNVGVKHLKVHIKGQADPVAQIALFAAVRPDEMTYTWDAAKAQVTVMVEKVEGETWNRLEAASDGQIL